MFQFRHGSKTLNWNGLLANQRLLLDSAANILSCGDRESLVALMNFIELKMDVIWVLLSVRREQENKGQLLRTFSYIGFEIIRPGQAILPSCRDHIFLAYAIDRPGPDLEIAHQSNDKP
ncbi:ornithine decarboxylase antizyme 3-like [Hyperolius riggenbachi]|uniref:ornithine decarboxylase antizyme 3-like n=1 Tax=Hyperolius riggenbachi TaxID=752182 RepID=UPI0035A2A90E